MENNQKYSKQQIKAIIASVLAIVSFFLPVCSGNGTWNLSSKFSYNIIGVLKMLFGSEKIVENVPAVFNSVYVISMILWVLTFVALIVLLVSTLLKKNVHFRRVLAVAIFTVSILSGMVFNNSMTQIAKSGNNYYGVYPEYKFNIKTVTGSTNNWDRGINKLVKDIEAEKVLTEYSNKAEMVETLKGLVEKADSYSFASMGKEVSDTTKKKVNGEIFTALKEMITVEDQPDVFATYFKTQIKQVSAVSSGFGCGFLLVCLFALIALAAAYNENNPNGFRNTGIYVNVMYAGLSFIIFFASLLAPMFSVTSEATAATGLKTTTLFGALTKLGALKDGSAFKALGANGTVSASSATLAAIFFVVALVLILVYAVLCAKCANFTTRRILAVVATACYIVAAICSMKVCSGVIGLSGYGFVFVGMAIANAIIPFTATIDKEKYKAFSIVNVIVFIAICAFILVPLWKVIVDSLDASAGYGMKMWPKHLSIEGYKTIITNPSMSKPFIISVVTTLGGTFLGLTLSTLGAYVLVQFDMPGRNFLANMLLFTMIFQGGMIPTYLTLQSLHMLDTLWAVVLPLSINVYNLVLMRNFFEGIPQSLIEAAQIDGCSPMGIFIKVVLPLSKAALASIGLFFAVAFWNDYTNFKLYIRNPNLYNFQMKLRAMIFSSDMPNNSSISENTLQNAAIMVAILPFMIVYPFLQKYFVKGVNIGAVKE